MFNIQVGTAITLAISDGSKAEGEAADILYHDSWEEELFSRRAKLDWLNGGADTGRLPNGVTVERGWLDDFRPKPFQNGEWIALPECFAFYLSGVQTKRDDFVYDVAADKLKRRVQSFLAASDNQAREMFHDSRDRKWVGAKAVPFSEAYVRHVAYRPLDRRLLYNHRAYGDFLRPELQAVWGTSNVGFYAVPSGTNAGPAVWCHALLPDYHAFRGNYGGYAFPLHDRRPSVASSNLAPALIAGLSAAYGEQIRAEDVFDAILCLLSASSYTLQFAEDLEDTFPHVPFPAQPATFREAVRLGREIRAVEAFARPPRDAFENRAFVRVETEPLGVVAAAIDHDAGTILLCADGSGHVSGLPATVWNFSVSGYRVLPRWLDARAGLRADYGFVQEFRDVCGRIAELTDLFTLADTVLTATLSETLTREALGFASLETVEGQDGDEGRS